MTSVEDILGRDEQIVYNIRQHWFGLMVRLLSHVALIVILVSAGVVSKSAFQQDSNPIIGTFTASDLILTITLVISLFLLTTASSDFLHWHTNHYVVTDRRVVQIRGLFSMSLIGVSLENINSIDLKQDLPGQVMNYGTIEISTTAQNLANVIENVARPAEFKQAVEDAIKNYERGYGYLDPVSETVPITVRADQPVRHTIEELAILRDRGILSAAEFEAKKREILSRM